MKIIVVAAALLFIGGGCMENGTFMQACIDKDWNYVSTKSGFTCTDPEHFVKIPESAF